MKGKLMKVSHVSLYYELGSLKIGFIPQLLGKESHMEFHENLSNGKNADNRSQKGTAPTLWFHFIP
jgi:hypothetical protein